LLRSTLLPWQDSVVLAHALSQAAAAAAAAGSGNGGASAEARLAAALPPALREFERRRAARCLPLTLRSNAMGALLQIGLPPVVAARDLYTSTLFSPSHFLDHTEFDAGPLRAAQ
jgi:hypothetical protein